MNKIVVIGSCNVDTILNVTDIPKLGETVLSSVVNHAFGGKGANQAAAVAKLGGNVSMIGCVGNDDSGKKMVEALESYGVNIDGIKVEKTINTGNAYICVSEAGNNSIVVYSGANSFVTPSLIKEFENFFTDATYCIVQFEIPIETVYYVAEICKNKSIKLIINPAPATIFDFNKLRDCYMIIPNETELDVLVNEDISLEEKAQKLYEYGFKNVLVTLGERGSLLINSEGKRCFQAFPASVVRDTTAAGDSFIGALAFSLSNNIELYDSICVASIAASISVGRIGAQTSLPSFDELQAKLHHLSWR